MSVTTLPGTGPQWFARPRADLIPLAALGALAAALLVRQIVHAAVAPGLDFVHVWQAGHQLIWTAHAYDDPLFTYPPSAALLVAPFGLLPYAAAKALMLALNVTAVAAAGALTLKSLGRLRDPRWVVGSALVMGVLDANASTWINGNVNGILLLAEVAALRAVQRDRWARAALLLGLTVALKPVLLPLFVVFVLRRRFAALAVAAGVPLVLLAAGWLVVADASMFLSSVVPFLASGAQIAYNDSLTGVANLLQWPDLAGSGARLAVLGLVVVAAGRWLMPTRAVAAPDGLAVHAQVLALLPATFLLAPMSETYYTIFLLPSLAAVCTLGRSKMLAMAGLCLGCFATLRLGGVPAPPDVHINTLLALRPSVGWLALLALVSTGWLRAGPQIGPAPRAPHLAPRGPRVLPFAGPERATFAGPAATEPSLQRI